MIHLIHNVCRFLRSESEPLTLCRLTGYIPYDFQTRLSRFASRGCRVGWYKQKPQARVSAPFEPRALWLLDQRPAERGTVRDRERRFGSPKHRSSSVDVSTWGRNEWLLVCSCRRRPPERPGAGQRLKKKGVTGHRAARTTMPNYHKGDRRSASQQTDRRFPRLFFTRSSVGPSVRLFQHRAWASTKQSPDPHRGS